MRALTWQGRENVSVETVPDPRDRGADRRDRPRDVHGHLRVRPAPVPRARRVPRRRRRARARGDGRRRGGRPAAPGPPGRRPGRRPVRDRLRHVLDVHAAGCSRQCETTQVAAAGQGRRAVRLHQALRPGARRAGAVPARAAGAVRPGRRARRRQPGRAVPVPVGRAAHRVAGGRVRGGARRAARSVVLGLGPIGQMAARIAAHRGAGLGDRRSTWSPSGSRWRAGTASTSSTSAAPTTSWVRCSDLTDGRGVGRGDRRRRHGGARLARRRGRAKRAATLLPDARRPPADREGRHRTGSPRCTRPSTSRAGAARCRSPACTAARSTRCR